MEKMNASYTLQHLAGCFCTLAVSLIMEADIYQLHSVSWKQSETHVAGRDF